MSVENISCGNPAEAGLHNPAEAGLYNPAEAGLYNPAKAGLYRLASGPVLSPRVSCFTPALSSMVTSRFVIGV